MYETVRVETEDSIGIVTLNRPEALNAVSRRLAREVVAALTQFGDEPAVGALVLTGAGQRAFSSGVDLKEARDMQIHEIEEVG
ncbi:MAG: enoyl-CoA hydratase/isomerase family protein [Candidatus Methylomirabilia bacterium]